MKFKRSWLVSLCFVVWLLAVAFIPAIYSLMIYRRRSAPD
jgi:hypothetical protein